MRRLLSLLLLCLALPVAGQTLTAFTRPHLLLTNAANLWYTNTSVASINISPNSGLSVWPLLTSHSSNLVGAPIELWFSMSPDNTHWVPLYWGFQAQCSSTGVVETLSSMKLDGPDFTKHSMWIRLDRVYNPANNFMTISNIYYRFN